MLKTCRYCLLFVSLFLIIVVKLISLNRSENTKADIWMRLLLRDRNGDIILNKSIQDLRQQPLKQWNYQHEVLAFIHIVKSGGTPFDSTLSVSKHKHAC